MDLSKKEGLSFESGLNIKRLLKIGMPIRKKQPANEKIWNKKPQTNMYYKKSKVE